jgi:hypothetical protein
MSAERTATAAPVSRAGRARQVLWRAQWFGVVLLPVWLVSGTALIAGGGYTLLFLSVLFAPMLLVLLLIAGLLSVGIRSSRRSHGGPWYVWLLVGVWACVAVQPFLIEGYSDVPTIPSALERLGVSQQTDQSLISFFFWAAAALLALAWIATGVAGSAPPFGDGSDRKKQQRRHQLTDRLDRLNSWRPDADPPDGPSRAAPGADSRS